MTQVVSFYFESQWQMLLHRISVLHKHFSIAILVYCCLRSSRIPKLCLSTLLHTCNSSIRFFPLLQLRCRSNLELIILNVSFWWLLRLILKFKAFDVVILYCLFKCGFRFQLIFYKSCRWDFEWFQILPIYIQDVQLSFSFVTSKIQRQ